jgi:hypothetical protein
LKIDARDLKARPGPALKSLGLPGQETAPRRKSPRTSKKAA